MDISPDPVAYDNAYLEVSQIDKVEDALQVMGSDPSVMSRLALASIMGKGEAVWVFEIAFQITRRGIHAAREQGVGGVSRVDLIVGDEGFEVKSSFTRFAARSPVEDTERWFLPDVEKLRKGTARGHQLITLATMINAEHVQKTFDVGHDHRDWDLIQAERQRGIAAYRSYADGVRRGPIRHIDLGRAEVPAHRGDMLLDALLFCVHDPVGALDAVEQPQVVADGA